MSHDLTRPADQPSSPTPLQRSPRGADARGLVGSVVDRRYSVERVLGVGGMSTVYLAHDMRLERNVALKVISPSLGHDDSFLQRFSREAKATARLSHPNVVNVLDRSAEEELPYIVFEYVRGQSLRSYLTEHGALPQVFALQLWRQLIAALSHAHEMGILHRDVKPDNVMLDQALHAKLTDFGLARARAESKTTTQLMGTAKYVAPEVLTDGRSDERSDLYSAGIVLFEMLTGRPPFTGQDPMSIAYAHVHQEIPSAASLRPELSPELDELIALCCARSPQDRPESAAALLEEIDVVLRVLRGGGQVAPRQPSRRPFQQPTGAEATRARPLTGPSSAEDRTMAMQPGATAPIAPDTGSEAPAISARSGRQQTLRDVHGGAHFGPLVTEEPSPTFGGAHPAPAAEHSETARPRVSKSSRRRAEREARKTARTPVASLRSPGQSAAAAALVLVLLIGLPLFAFSLWGVGERIIAALAGMMRLPAASASATLVGALAQLL